MLVFIAWRNIWRNKVRSMLTVSALAGGLILVGFYAGMFEGMTRQMVRMATEVSTGHIQIKREAYIEDQDLYATMDWRYLEALEQQYPELTFAPRLYAAGLASTDETSVGVMIKAVDLQREQKVTRMLKQVKSGVLDFSKSVNNEGIEVYSIMVGNQLAKNIHLKENSELIVVTQSADGSIGNAIYRVAGILKSVDPAFDRMGVMMSLEAYEQLMYLSGSYDIVGSDSGVFHELAIKTPDAELAEQDQIQLVKTITELSQSIGLDEFGGPIVVRNWKEINPTVSDMLELNSSITLVFGVIIIGLASLGMLNTMMMSIHERTHEFGILLAIGMKQRWILLMVMLESFFLSLVSAFFGLILSIWLISYFGTHGIDFSGYLPEGFDWGGIAFEPVFRTHLEFSQQLSSAFLMIVIALFASLIPAWRIIRYKPAHVLK